MRQRAGGGRTAGLKWPCSSPKMGTGSSAGADTMRAGGMATGHTLFADLFTYVLLFDQTHLQGEFQPSYEQVRRDIAALFQQEKATAKRQGMLDKDFQDAGFAVVAWADETILKHTAWKYHHEWNTYPLQLEYYQTRNAGEEFFERLEQLGAAQQAVRESISLPGFGL